MHQYKTSGTIVGNGAVVVGKWSNGEAFWWAVGYQQDKETVKIIRDAGGTVSGILRSFKRKTTNVKVG